MLNIYKLNYDDALIILKNKKAKYLSQNKINRHYLIKYKDDNTFVNETYEDNIKIGESYGNYNLLTKDGDVYIHIKYENLFNSPNISSPFNNKNSFYSKLFEGYTIGPLYSSVIPSNNELMISIFYHNFNSNLGGIKILNFY